MTNTAETKKRKYYKEGEVVFIKPLKCTGTVKKLDVEPRTETTDGKYEANVEYNANGNTVTSTFKLWEIDKYDMNRSKPSRKQRNRDVVYFAKVRPTARIPSKREEDGCYDIYADFEGDRIVIHAGETKLIPTGIASAFSSKYRFNAKRERGSTGVIALETFSGQIDSGYRDEWFIILHNSNSKDISIDKEVTSKIETEDYIQYPYSKAVCQAALEFVPVVDVKEISYEELEKIPSMRGKGKIGSSGK